MTTDRLQIAIVYVGNDGESAHNIMINNQQPLGDWYFIDCLQRKFTGNQELCSFLSRFDIIFLILTPNTYCQAKNVSQVIQECRKSDTLIIGIALDPFFLRNDDLRKFLYPVWRELFSCTDTIIKVPPDDLISIDEFKLPKLDVQQLLLSFSKAIKELLIILTEPNLIGLDFADIKGVLTCGNILNAGRGTATGATRALKSANQAMDDVLQGCKIDNVAGVIIDISASANTFHMSEFMESSDYIQSLLSEEVSVVVGARYDDSLCNSMKIIVHMVVNSKNTEDKMKLSLGV